MPRRNLNDLLAFVTVAREGSFTKAAGTLGASIEFVDGSSCTPDCYPRQQPAIAHGVASDPGRFRCEPVPSATNNDCWRGDLHVDPLPSAVNGIIDLEGLRDSND